MQSDDNASIHEPAKLLYGVWLPGVGWLKVNSSPLAFEIRDVAESTAGRMGDGARVEFIDDSLADLENQLLEAERNQAAAAALEAERRNIGFAKRLLQILKGEPNGIPTQSQ